MSTTHDHAKLVQQHDQDGQGTTLPTFTSIRDQSPRQITYAESSNASSSRSAARWSQTRSEHGSGSRDSPDLRAGGSDKASKFRGIGGTIRRMKRASGGFLLDSSPASSAVSRSILSRKDVKGKKKDKLDSPTLLVPANGVGINGRNEESTRSSPLSSELKPPFQANDLSNPPAQIQVFHFGQQGMEPPPSHSNSSRRDASMFGFDTDPAQIVDMALRLNEGRQKQALERRYVSSGSHQMRNVSIATSAPPRSSTPLSAEKYDRFALQRSRRKSLNVDPITPTKAAIGHASAEVTSPMLSEKLSPEHDTDEEKQEVRISRATQNRVEKAKTYFELAYEHRRLLSHLPPLHRPGTGVPESKLYNPLQYARNRKLRFRERTPINTEEDGWHDVEKVRAWVDAVVSSHANVRHDPLECVRLPPLTLQEKPEEGSDDDSNDAVRKVRQSGKPRRPKSDWITHPGDLIADAFWTEQGLNKQKIYDRDNVPIFPPNTRFHFSGWRNKTPISVPDELKYNFSSPETSPLVDTKESVTQPRDLPTFESSHKDHTWVGRKFKFSKTLIKGAAGKKQKNHNIFDTSSSESSIHSDDDKSARGRKHQPKGREKILLPDGDPFATPIESADKIDHPRQFTEVDGASSSKRGSMDRASLLKYLQRSVTSNTDPNDDDERQKLSKRRKFLHTINLDSEHEKGRDSLEYESTAPGTPLTYGFPSIAINLSPPDSREPSPRRNGKGSFLGIVKDKMHASRDKVDRTDFAEQGSSRGSHDHISPSHLRRPSSDGSRGPSPMGRRPGSFARQRTNLFVDESAYPNSQYQEHTVNKVSSRATDPLPQRSHRVRGMFKGGRIAELVGNEMSRMGDYIWKRDPPNRPTVSADSNSGYESDSDELLDPKQTPIKALTRDRRRSLSHSIASTNSAISVSGVSKPLPHDTSQFHVQGLPSFTSPFQRDREAQEKKKRPQSPGGTPQRDQEKDYDSDPISTAAAARRSVGKSPRLDRIAPPKLDISAATPESRRNSYGFGTTLGLARTRSASQLYNGALNDERSEQGRSSHRVSTAHFARPYVIPYHDLSRKTSNQSGSNNVNNRRVTTQDFIRTRALFLASAIKATNISAYCDDIPNPQASFLFSAFESTGASGSEINQKLPVPRKEEHIIAARHLIEHLASQSQQFNDHLNHFTQTTTRDLHRNIQTVEDMTESTLFPRLSKLSDQAGQLAQKLTTTSTLAVKGVDDEVTEAVRIKRRGPYKWGRLLAYKLIEIGVVGLLWVVWAVVKGIRVGIALVRGLWRMLGWLLFWR